MDETFGGAMDSAREAGNEMADKVGEMAGKASSKINDMAGKASNKLNDMAETASTKVNDGLEYLRTRNLSEIADDAQELVRKHPTGSLLAAVAVGFMAAHYLRTGRRPQYE